MYIFPLLLAGESCCCINPALTLIVRLSLGGSQLSNSGGLVLPAWYGDWFYHREAGHWYLVLSTRSPLASSHLNPSLDNSQLESKHNLFCHQWKFSCILQELCLQPSTKILLLEERRSVVGKVSVWFETRRLLCIPRECGTAGGLIGRRVEGKLSSLRLEVLSANIIKFRFHILHTEVCNGARCVM